MSPVTPAVKSSTYERHQRSKSPTLASALRTRAVISSVVLGFRRWSLCGHVLDCRNLDVRSQLDRSALAVDLQALRQSRSSAICHSIPLREFCAWIHRHSVSHFVYLRTEASDSCSLAQEKCENHEDLISRSEPSPRWAAGQFGKICSRLLHPTGNFRRWSLRFYVILNDSASTDISPTQHHVCSDRVAPELRCVRICDCILFDVHAAAWPTIWCRCGHRICARLRRLCSRDRKSHPGCWSVLFAGPVLSGCSHSIFCVCAARVVWFYVSKVFVS